MDIKSKEERSLNMSRIRAKNTKPELFIRSELHKLGYRFRVNSKLAEGQPDIYFTEKRIAVFVHGCFWHRHKNCSLSYTPKTNTMFWESKFKKNIERDRKVVEKLADKNIRILVIWECTVRKMRKDSETKSMVLKSIVTFMNNKKMSYLEI